MYFFTRKGPVYLQTTTTQEVLHLLNGQPLCPSVPKETITAHFPLCKFPIAKDGMNVALHRTEQWFNVTILCEIQPERCDPL